MIWTQVVVLAVVQGLTEFLPISSSAHLILVPIIAGWQDQGLAFDVAVHVGSLAAVMIYFRQEVARLLLDWSQSCVQRRAVGESNLAWAVIIGTLPVIVAGLLFGDAVDTVLRSPLVIAWATIGFGIVLAAAVVLGRANRDEQSIRPHEALLLGVAQAIAIIPGTSRSGITMAAGLFIGLNQTASARFSFLLSIPVIALAGAWKALEVAQQGVDDQWIMLIAGALLSGISAYICIAAFLALLQKIGMMPFVAYRLVLGVVLLVVFWA